MARPGKYFRQNMRFPFAGGRAAVISVVGILNRGRIRLVVATDYVTSVIGSYHFHPSTSVILRPDVLNKKQ